MSCQIYTVVRIETIFCPQRNISSICFIYIFWKASLLSLLVMWHLFLLSLKHDLGNILNIRIRARFSPSCLDPGRVEKNNLIFYFHTSLRCLKCIDREGLTIVPVTNEYWLILGPWNKLMVNFITCKCLAYFAGFPRQQIVEQSYG